MTAGITRPPPSINPFDRRRWRDTESSRRITPRKSAVNRRYQPFSQIYRKRSGHAGWPPSPAHILNQNYRFDGTPNDPVRSENALTRDIPIALRAVVLPWWGRNAPTAREIFVLVRSSKPKSGSGIRKNIQRHQQTHFIRDFPDGFSQPPKTVAQSRIDRKRGLSSRFGGLGWATRRIRAHVKMHSGAR
jgi:hypothetical protein